MPDGRKNNGGHSTKGFAGRKRKDEEEKAKRLSIKALVDTFGSEEKAFTHAAQKAMSDDKQAYQYYKILIEYGYGKPKEEMNLNLFREAPLWED